MCIFFFFNDTATTEIYPLSLHDALPISFLDERLLGATSNAVERSNRRVRKMQKTVYRVRTKDTLRGRLALDLQRDEQSRSEEHTSELQSQSNLVCRLLLEKKN